VFENGRKCRLRMCGARRRGREHPDGGLDTSARCSPPAASASLQTCMDVVGPISTPQAVRPAVIGAFPLIGRQGGGHVCMSPMSASRALRLAVARACDQGRTTRNDAAGAILYAGGTGDLDGACKAIQCLGGKLYPNTIPNGPVAARCDSSRERRGPSEIRRWPIGSERWRKPADQARRSPLDASAFGAGACLKARFDRLKRAR